MGIIGSFLVWYLSILLVASFFGKGKSFATWSGNLLSSIVKTILGFLPTLLKVIGKGLYFLFQLIALVFRGLWNLIRGFFN